MLVYVIAALAGAALLLLALKAWAGAKARPTATPTGFTFRTNASEIELYVRGADNWWQHLRWMPLFWVGVLGTSIMLGLAVHYGMTRGEAFGVAAVIILISLFGIADLAIPFLALSDATDDGKIGWKSKVFVPLATIMSIMAMIGSTSEIATTTSARMDTGVVAMKDNRKLLEQKQKERDSIKIDRGADALAKLAEVEEELQKREASKERNGCGKKCDEHRKIAADYRAREADQRQKERLTGEIEDLKRRMAGAGASEQRNDSDAMATVVSGLTGGWISRDVFRVYFLPVLGGVLVTLITVLWMYVGDALATAIRWERQYRAEIADDQRSTLGLPAKYTQPLATTPLLEGPKTGRTDAANDPTLVLNMNLADMRKRFANDQDLLDTDKLFGTLLMKGDGGKVPIAALYRAYQVACLTRDPLARYMTAPTMAAKLMVVAQHRDDMRMTADGIIEGWVLKPANERTLEVSDAQ